MKVKIRLPKGEEIFVEPGRAILDYLPDRAGLVAKVDGKLVDLTSTLGETEEVEILDFDTPEGKETYWHTTSHVMAQAVKEIFPDAKLAIGPPIEEGFYYDFDLGGKTFSPEDLEQIERRMREIISRDLKVKRQELTKEEAVELFKKKDEPYKVELLEEIEDERVSVYWQGDFVDLCRGPHLPSTGYIGAFKLLSSSSSYWKGDEKGPVLQRIYGISFPTKEELDDFIHRLEEAKRRDHRKLGKELDLFSISSEVGPGLILWHPKGAIVRRITEDFLYKTQVKRGYVFVYTPHVGKARLWQTSGHLDFYRENMFSSMDVEGEEYFVKPMNCPFHIQIYRSQLRSYRDLPIRMAEFGTVYRYERSGVLHGLMRVRGFTQDDAHIFCRPDQVEEEVVAVIDLTLYILKSFGLKSFRISLSTKPERYVGEPKSWERAEESLKRALMRLGLDFEVNEGEGAFYGPKIDIEIRDAIGRYWQCSTIQFDFNLPERFNITFRDRDGIDKRPYMIHRALVGSIERFMAILIEHYAGNFPFWLSPVQVVIIPVNDDVHPYAKKVAQLLEEKGFRVITDLRKEKVGYKISEAERQKVPYMLIVGKREQESNTVSLRKHGKGDMGVFELDKVFDLFQGENVPFEA